MSLLEGKESCLSLAKGQMSQTLLALEGKDKIGESLCNTLLEKWPSLACHVSIETLLTKGDWSAELESTGEICCKA